MFGFHSQWISCEGSESCHIGIFLFFEDEPCVVAPEVIPKHIGNGKNNLEYMVAV